MKRFPLLILIFSLLGVIVACQRDDDEPEALTRRISRLYVSTSDYDPSAGANYYNIYVLDPADSSVFPPENIDSISGFKSSAKGGKFIHYTPFNNGLVFQGSQNDPVYLDTAVQIMRVSNTGVLGSTGRLANRKFNDTRGLSYTVLNQGNLTEDFLLILNTDTLFAVKRPTTKGTFTRPDYYMPIDYYPWGINIIDRDVIVSAYTGADKPNSINGIYVYKGLASKLMEVSVDSLLVPNARLDFPIANAGQVRGISYSKSKDLLLVTDFSGVGINSVGRVLFFENFSSKTTSQTISPDRIVTSSVLKQPQDIAIDTRVDAKYFYVADPIAKRVFRFLITDNGNVTPNQSINLFNKTPFSLSLDAR